MIVRNATELDTICTRNDRTEFIQRSELSEVVDIDLSHIKALLFAYSNSGVTLDDKIQVH